MDEEIKKFVEFPKMGRLSREMIITEKIDETNGCIDIDKTGTIMTVGSRTRWIKPGDEMPKSLVK